MDRVYYQDFMAASTIQQFNKIVYTGYQLIEPDLEYWLYKDPGYYTTMGCPNGLVQGKSAIGCGPGTSCNGADCVGGNWMSCSGGSDKEYVIGANKDYCPDSGNRLWEYNKRKQVFDEFFALVRKRMAMCPGMIDRCQGQETCFMDFCQRPEFDYACVFKPPVERSTYTFAFTKSRNFFPQGYVRCPRGTNITVVKAEIGRFDQVYDVTDQFRKNHIRDGRKADVDADIMAGYAGLDVNSLPPQTARVETYCECGVGYEVEPLPDGTCVPCKVGQYRSFGMGLCTNCPPGTRSKTAGDLLDGCVPCDPGSYSDSAGSDRCTLCDRGTYNSKSGSTSSADCIPVPISSISLADRTGYEECPLGYENYQDDRTDCYLCPLGYVRPLGQASCSPCPAGTYSPNLGGGDCLPTPKGAYQSQIGQSGYVMAPVNHYVPSERSKVPIPCPDGKVTITTGAQSVDECRTIPAFPDCGSFATCDELLQHLGVTNAVLGDGFCWGDPRWCVNTELCNWDGGDCCPETCQKSALAVPVEPEFQQFLGGGDYYPYSCHPSTFRCVKPRAFSANLTSPSCGSNTTVFDPKVDAHLGDECVPRPDVWGDGLCDPDQNFEKCGYDGGDCCLNTCKQSSLEGSCTPSTLMDCRASDADVDIVDPVLHNLPEGPLTGLTCSDNPPWPAVSATDNDPCFEAMVETYELGTPGCSSWTKTRTWTAVDPTGNTVSFTQTLEVGADTTPPAWYKFPPNVNVTFLDGTSLHPDSTGWPQIAGECSLPVQLSWTDQVVISNNMQCQKSRRIERTWSAVDACGNEATRVQEIQELPITPLTTTFGEAWYLQIASVQGNIEVVDQESRWEGAVGASEKVKLKSHSISSSTCEQSMNLEYSIVAGVDVDVKKSTFITPGVNKVAYGDKAKIDDDYEHLLVKDGAVIDWDSLASAMEANSAYLSQTQELGTMFDGPMQYSCEDIELPCTALSGTERNDTTKGIATTTHGANGNIMTVFSGTSDYFNLFEIGLDSFVSDLEDASIDWMFNVPPTSTVVVNVRGDLASIGSGNGGGTGRRTLRRSLKKGDSSKVTVESSLPIVDLGTLPHDQLLINLPEVVDYVDGDAQKLVLIGDEDAAITARTPIPYSILAPKLILELNYADSKGQILVADFKGKEVTKSYSLWWGNVVGN